MIRLIFVALFSLAFLTTGQQAAEACTCEERGPDKLVAGAEQVLVARTGATTKGKRGYETRFSVLGAIKGEATASYVWRHEDRSPLCGPSYAAGEVVLLFINKSSLALCAGNYGLTSQARDIPAYLKAAGTKSTTASHKAMESALKHSLTSYLHKRHRILAHFPSLTGKLIRIQGSTIRFKKNLSAKQRAAGILISDAVRFGSLVVVSGRYNREGVSFHVLLQETKSGFSLLHKSVYEN